MSIISLKNKDLTIIEELLEVIIKNKIVTLKTNINYDLLKRNAKEYVLNKKNISELKEFSYYDINNYIIDESLDENYIFNYMMALSSISKEVKKLIEINSGKRKEFNPSKYGSLDLSIIPPIDVYEYVGNNKLSINPSGKGYGLLFE